jgi:hypothetical protein
VAVFDCALHFRFLQKAAEAMFEMGQASVAATLACQKRIHAELTSEPVASPSSSHTSPYPNPQAPAQAAAGPQREFVEQWFAIAGAFSMAYWSKTASEPAVRALPMNPLFGAAAFNAFWDISPWTMYQGPMVAMMLSRGVPYAVAAPTARASTSAMDAADAAYAQWRKIFDSPQGRKSLDRNVTAAIPAPWSNYLH